MVNYRLQGLAGESVDVPDDYARRASNLVRLATVAPVVFYHAGEDRVALTQLLEPRPYLRNPAILNRTMRLVNDPDSALLRDEVFLRVCINLNEKRLREGLSEVDRQKARGLDSRLVDLLRRVEEQREKSTYQPRHLT